MPLETWLLAPLSSSTHTLRYKNTFKDTFPLQKDNIIVLGHRKIYAHTLTHLLFWTSSIIA